MKLLGKEEPLDYQMKHRHRLIIPCMLLFQVYILGQESPDSGKKHLFTSRLCASYVVGGQFFNDHFLYNPGFSGQFTQSYRVAEFFEAGVGAGYLGLMDESFVPFYLEAYGYRKKQRNSPVIRFQAGYSAAWFHEDHFPADYQLGGGFYLSAGLGRKIQVGTRYSVLFHWSYCHQSGSISYQIFGGEDYSAPVSYDMLKLTFGIMRE